MYHQLTAQRSDAADAKDPSLVWRTVPNTLLGVIQRPVAKVYSRKFPDCAISLTCTLISNLKRQLHH